MTMNPNNHWALATNTIFWSQRVSAKSPYTCRTQVQERWRLKALLNHGQLWEVLKWTANWERLNPITGCDQSSFLFRRGTFFLVRTSWATVMIIMRTWWGNFRIEVWNQHYWMALNFSCLPLAWIFILTTWINWSLEWYAIPLSMG